MGRNKISKEAALMGSRGAMSTKAINSNEARSQTKRWTPKLCQVARQPPGAPPIMNNGWPKAAENKEQPAGRSKHTTLAKANPAAFI
jgi:hypothetical protein